MANEVKKYLDNAGMVALVDQIKAEDAKVKAYVDAHIEAAGKTYDAAGAAATAEANAKAHANTEIAKLADGAVKANTDAIAKLNGGATEEGSVAKAVADAKALVDADVEAVEAKADKNAEDIAAITNADTGILKQAKDYVDGEVEDVQEAVDTLAGKVGEVPAGSTVMGIIANIQENAYDDTAIRGLISDLDAGKADKEQVAKDIAAAVKAEEDARKEAVAGVQGAVETLSGTHAADKKALEDAIALKADITALNEVSDVANAAVKQADYDVKVAALEAEDARIAGLVSAEAERAAGVEAGIDERLVKVEAFFKGAAEDEGEGENLQNALDTLVEIQTYITSDGAAADQMVKDIAANKKAIEDHAALDHDFAGADAALKAELEGKINGKVAQGDFDTLSGKVTTAEGKITTLEGEMDTVEGKVSTLEGQMTAVQSAVATKVEQEAYNAKIAALEGKDTAIEGRLDAVEALMGDGEGSVADQIADAKAELQGKLDTAIEGAKTDASNKDAVVLAEAQKGIDAVQLAVDTHANNGDIHVTAEQKTAWTTAAGKAHEHSNLEVLEGITAGKVSAWDAAEGNAKAHADSLNTAMTTKVDGIDGRVEDLEETIVDKAEQADLEAAVDRIEQNETDIAALKESVGLFQPFTANEIKAMFGNAEI